MSRHTYSYIYGTSISYEKMVESYILYFKVQTLPLLVSRVKYNAYVLSMYYMIRLIFAHLNTTLYFICSVCFGLFFLLSKLHNIRILQLNTIQV